VINAFAVTVEPDLFARESPITVAVVAAGTV